jgi:TonB family protein
MKLFLLIGLLVAAPVAAQAVPETTDSAVAPGTLAPRSRNGLRMAFQSNYPALLRDAGVGGAVLASFRVTPEGRVERGSFRVESSDEDMFSDATARVVSRLRFEPCPVPVMVFIRAEWRPVEGTLRILRVVPQPVPDRRAMGDS